MEANKKTKKIQAIKYYYTQIVGNAPSKAQVKKWEALDDYALIKTYNAWQDLFTALCLIV